MQGAIPIFLGVPRQCRATKESHECRNSTPVGCVSTQENQRRSYYVTASYWLLWPFDWRMQRSIVDNLRLQCAPNINDKDESNLKKTQTSLQILLSTLILHARNTWSIGFDLFGRLRCDYRWCIAYVAGSLKGCLYYDTCTAYMCAAHVRRTCAMNVYSLHYDTCTPYRCTAYMYGVHVS